MRYNYDFMAQEWDIECGACGAILYAPTRGELAVSFGRHTRGAECLGGY